MVECDVDPTFHLKVESNKKESEKYKEYRHKWNDNPKNFIVEDVPIHIDIETNTHCNLKCYMCMQSYDNVEKEVIDFDIAKKVIDECSKKGSCSIKTMYRGEPLLYKKLPDLIKYAKNKGFIEVMFNTNATLLTDDTAKALIEAGLDKLICSVDGYTKEVYENIRIGANFESVLNNIKNLQNLKKQMGTERPTIRVQMVDTPRNHSQIDGYIKFWEKIVDDVAIEDLLDWKAIEENGTPLKGWACAQLWQRLIILADGDVLPCCRALKGFTKKLTVLGNIYKDTIEQLWKGKTMNKLRTLHMEGKSHEIKMCRLCGLRKSVIFKMKKI